MSSKSRGFAISEEKEQRAESIKNSAGQGWQWVVLLRRG